MHRRVLLCAFVLSSVASAQSLGSAFTYQGELTESGQAATGLYDLQVCLFDSPSASTALACAPEFEDWPVEAGLFTLELDFGADAFSGQERYLELRVRAGSDSGAYTELLPRQLVRPTPEALRASRAGSVPWTGLTDVPPGFADGIDDDSGGTVTRITAGTGLSGGEITSSGTIAIADAGVGLAQIDPTQVQARVGGSCPAGHFLIAVGEDGSVSCAADAVGGSGSVTSITAGTGLSGGEITSSGTIAIAEGGVGLAQIDTAQVQARIGSMCPPGSFLRGVLADGSPLCDQPAPAVPQNVIATIADQFGSFRVGGNGTSVAVGADGLPFVAYYDQQLSQFRLASCGNPTCTSVRWIRTLDAQDLPGLASRMVLGADGLPVLSYAALPGGSAVARVAKCNDAECGSVTVNRLDPTASGGLDTAIVIPADGLPLVAFSDDTNSAISVAKCADAACGSTSSIARLGSPCGNILGADMVLGQDGLPVLSFYCGVSGEMKVAKCASADCSGGATITTLDSGFGRPNRIVLGSDGLPLVAYVNTVAGVMKLSKCQTADCSSVSTLTLGDPVLVGQNISMALGAEGFPLIVYYEETNHALKLAACLDHGCAQAKYLQLDAAGLPGENNALAIGPEGRPVISYHEQESRSVRVITCGTTDCQ